MHHASPTIGAIAAALAKAQAELPNPEKSLVATMPSPARKEAPRTFRYAPLSRGLELVRASLGRHEIAVIQTTAIDDSAGLIRLVTVLAHASGEWLSSDWPVCPISETASPHRLGAALTYARRYALFTLVGIAGEDDLDAPDLPDLGASATPTEARAPQKPNGGPHEHSSLTPRGRAWKQANNLEQTLDSPSSAASRDQMLDALEALSSADQVTAWARGILKQKNVLTSDDARVVEQAFEAKLASLNPGQFAENEFAEEQHANAADADHPTALAPASPAPRASLVKTVRRRDKQHLKFVRTQPCLVCGRVPSEPHHLRFSEPRALGRKVSDEFTVPLCRAHHRELHNRGNERAWWEALKIDPAPVAQQLWSATR
jgi:hypothetical protein